MSRRRLARSIFARGYYNEDERAPLGSRFPRRSRLADEFLHLCTCSSGSHRLGVAAVPVCLAVWDGPSSGDAKALGRLVWRRGSVTAGQPSPESHTWTLHGDRLCSLLNGSYFRSATSRLTVGGATEPLLGTDAKPIGGRHQLRFIDRWF